MNTRKRNTILLVATISIAAAVAGCMTTKKQVVGTDSSGATFTNTVTVVNEGNLALDATGVQVATAIAVNTVLVQTKYDPQVLQALKNAKTALDGILTGVNSETSQQVVAMLKLQNNASLSSQVDTLLQAISAAEQNLLAKYGATVAGEITVAMVKAVDAGLTVGLNGH